LVASLSHPGGNITGMSLFVSDIWVRTVELLKQLAPKTSLIAYLVNPSSPNAELYSSGAVDAARAMGINVQIVKASTDLELDTAFAALKDLGADGLVVPNEPFFDSRRDKIVGFAAQQAVPAIYTIREYVSAGGLMS
jgi:putative ABC transport system substrate-binding protein